VAAAWFTTDETTYAATKFSTQLDGSKPPQLAWHQAALSAPAVNT
jgi:hypothetical protein